MEYNQPTAAPTSKVKAVGYAGVIVTVIVGILAMFGVIVPDGLSQQATDAVGATIVLVTFIQGAIAFIAGYMKRSKK